MEKSTHDEPKAAAASPRRSPAQIVALVFGLVFLLVALLGFIPGFTTHYSDMSFAGHNSHAQLLGLFMVSVLLNLVHLAFGVAGVGYPGPPRRRSPI